MSVYYNINSPVGNIRDFISGYELNKNQAIRNWFYKNIMPYYKDEDDYLEDKLKSFDLNYLRKASTKGTPENESWKIVQKIIQENKGSKFSAKQLYDFYTSLKKSLSSGKLVSVPNDTKKKMFFGKIGGKDNTLNTQGKTFKELVSNSKESPLSFDPYLVDKEISELPRRVINKIKQELKKSLPKETSKFIETSPEEFKEFLEDEFQYALLFGEEPKLDQDEIDREVEKYKKEYLNWAEEHRTLARFLKTIDDQNLRVRLSSQYENKNKTKMDIPIKIMVDGLVDPDGNVINKKPFYTNLSNIPKYEVIDGNKDLRDSEEGRRLLRQEVEDNYIGKQTYVPNSKRYGDILTSLYNLYKQTDSEYDFSILDPNQEGEKSPSETYKKNLEDTESLRNYVKNTYINTNLDKYFDDLIDVYSSGKTGKMNLSILKNKLKKKSKGDASAAEKYFVYDPKQRKVIRIPETGLDKVYRKGMRYEHVVPHKVMADILVYLYDYMSDENGDIENISEFKKVAGDVIENLYTIAWIDNDNDLDLDLAGYQFEMPNGFSGIINNIIDKGINNISKDKILDYILSRYRKAGVLSGKDKLTSLKDASGKASLSAEIPLNATYGDLAPYKYSRNPDSSQKITKQTLDSDIENLQAEVSLDEFRPKFDIDSYYKGLSDDKLDVAFSDSIKKIIKSRSESKIRGLGRAKLDTVFIDILKNKLNNIENIYIGPSVNKVIESGKNTGTKFSAFQESKTPKLTSMLFGYYG